MPKRTTAPSSFFTFLLITVAFRCSNVAKAFLPSSILNANPIRSATAATSTQINLKRGGKKKKKAKDNTITVNRLAYRNYEIIETLEAGISLVGTEVKSIRDGKMNLRDGYIRPDNVGRGCALYNVHIGKHNMAGEFFNHEERRVRQLLVRKEQARRLKQKVEQQGMTIVPLKAYFNDGNKVKLEIALVKGKNVRDKRQTIKEREAKRETNRMVKNFRL